jgi:twitching motility protein PilJ
LFLLVLSLAAVGFNFFWVAKKNDEDRQYIAFTSEIQVQSQQIAKFATEAAGGNLDAFEDLRQTRDRVQENLDYLVNGRPSTQLPASPPSVQESLVRVQQVWQPIREASDQILDSRELVVEITNLAQEFENTIPRLQARTDEVVGILVGSGAPPRQIYVASRQLVLADRMLRSVGEILQGGDGAVTAADRFGRDAALFGRVLDGLLQGSEEMGISAIENEEALPILGEIYDLFGNVGENVQEILDASSSLFDVKQAAQNIFLDSEELLDAATVLETEYTGLEADRPLSVWSGLALAAFSVILIGLLIFILWRDQRKRLAVTQELNQRNQEAILRLLDEMGSLAEGDLTVEATVSEDVTGAIADSMNFAIEALRNLVTTINETAVQVSSAAQETRATAMHLAEASEHQAQQITSASQAINEMATSIDDVSKNATESSEVAQRSVQIATKGGDVVRRTIDGMDNIREQIQETSKRIKRLGESSQEIGDIVELINDIAEQTNILSLNAAIQAGTAGEAGRGFAVVADEVQRLAERASNATKQIEALVKTIQTDTNEAVISMEQTTSEVVAGAKLAEDAGDALTEIESVSNQLAELIENISGSAKQQAAAATNISSTMNVIQEITTQTSEGTNQTAESIGNLAELAADLRKSVADFKLPQQTH